MSCAGCERLAAARRGERADFIAELSETLVFLHDEQRYEGWCVVFLRDHVEHLADLEVDRQARVFRDVAAVAAALRRTLAPARLNYECLGNVLAHVHWHVIPRRPGDPDPQATVWARPAAERALHLPPARQAELVRQIRQSLLA